MPIRRKRVIFPVEKKTPDMPQLPMFKIPFFLIFLSLTSLAQANFSFTPIVGYEEVQQTAPESTKTRFIYGARFYLGPEILSAEFELTRGKDTQSRPADDYTREEEVTNMMAGLRTTHALGSYFGFHLRAGAHTRKRSIVEQLGAVETDSSPAMYVSPYAGTGLSFRPASFFTLHAGITAIFTGKPNNSDREYQTTLGLSFAL